MHNTNSKQKMRQVNVHWFFCGTCVIMCEDFSWFSCDMTFSSDILSKRISPVDQMKKKKSIIEAYSLAFHKLLKAKWNQWDFWWYFYATQVTISPGHVQNMILRLNARFGWLEVTDKCSVICHHQTKLSANQKNISR